MTWFGPLATLLAALVAGGVAIFVALAAYPKQKRQDRQLKIDEEKRAVFREYLRGVESLLNYTAIANGEETAHILLKNKSLLNEISLFADQTTITHMEVLWAHVVNFAMKMRNIPFEERAERQGEWEEDRKVVDKAFHEAMNAARRELELPHVLLMAEMAVLQMPRPPEEDGQAAGSDISEAAPAHMNNRKSPKQGTEEEQS